MRTLMQCVDCDRRFHIKAQYWPGTGVVMSGGEYRRLMGKILVPGGEVRRLGLKGRTPFPFVVVHSGKMTIALFGCWESRVFRSVSFDPFGGYSCGFERACSIAPKSEMHRTWRVCGYETVNMGSNIAARYRESIGEVKHDAIISPCCGTRPWCFFASEPFLTPSICKSIHHMPGIPSIIHRIAFLTNDPSGNHCRNRK